MSARQASSNSATSACRLAMRSRSWALLTLAIWAGTPALAGAARRVCRSPICLRTRFFCCLDVINGHLRYDLYDANLLKWGRNPVVAAQQVFVGKTVRHVFDAIHFLIQQ